MTLDEQLRRTQAALGAVVRWAANGDPEQECRLAALASMAADLGGAVIFPAAVAGLPDAQVDAINALPDPIVLATVLTLAEARQILSTRSGAGTVSHV